ncbi:hypothetical protein, partial [Aeromonas caviae]|uniref:hypothetical protein n=1 Tax=Aeromonas caviae TaxID=648 RepID=UPI003F74274C
MLDSDTKSSTILLIFTPSPAIFGCKIKYLVVNPKNFFNVLNRLLFTSSSPVLYSNDISETSFDFCFSKIGAKEGANKRGNSSRLTQSFHFFMFEPI